MLVLCIRLKILWPFPTVCLEQCPFTLHGDSWAFLLKLRINYGGYASAHSITGVATLFSKSGLTGLILLLSFPGFFAFTIFNLGHLNYMQMIIRFMVPVVFYAAYKMVTTPSVKYFFIYCFGIIWQIYCVFYTGIYLFYFSLLFIFIFYLISKRWSDFLYYFKRENRWHTTAVIAFSIFTLLILVIPYIKISSIVGVVHFGDVKPNLPYFRSYLFPQESSVTWKFLVNLARPDAPAWWLHYMFPGAIPIAALIFAPLILLYNKIKKIDTPLILKSLIITSCLIVIFHVQTHNGISLYRLLFYIPGFNSIRVLTRFMNVEIFILLILCAYALKNAHSKYIFIFLLLVFADNLFIPSLPREQKAGLVLRKEKLQNELGKFDLSRYKAVALIDSTQPAYVTNIDMMLVAQQKGLQTINGYSSYCPAQLVEFSKENTEKGLIKWMNNEEIPNEEVLLLKLNFY
jgi:hypothetical protein